MSSPGAALAEHPDVDKLAFTGSTVTGRSVMRAGAGTIKRVSLGSAASRRRSSSPTPTSTRRSSGPCSASISPRERSARPGSRVLVERPVYDEFVQRFADKAGRIRVGMPPRWETQLGALINKRQCDRVYEYVEIGKAEGATVVLGGKRPDDPELAAGNFIEPTVFAGVTNDMRIAQEEIFGPVVVVIPFDGEEEAVRLADDVRYGLAAGIWTRAANWVAHRLEAGSIWSTTSAPTRARRPSAGRAAPATTSASSRSGST